MERESSTSLDYVGRKSDTSNGCLLIKIDINREKEREKKIKELTTCQTYQKKKRAFERRDYQRSVQERDAIGQRNQRRRDDVC